MSKYNISAMSKLEEKPRVFLEEFRVKNAPNDYGFADEKWSFKKFTKKFRIIIVRMNDFEMEFDLIGIQPAFANAFRRLMLSEVPSMAIEKVAIRNNTSIIQDEVLAHRLGLIPLKADPRLFEYRAKDSTEGTEFDTLEFSLKVKCTNNKTQIKDSYRPEDLYENHCVYSSQIKWHPIGNQASVHKEIDVGPVHGDILISKMRPGHELDLHLVAVKGIGSDHAKFSPVATASYRLLPEIILTREVTGSDAKLLQTCFSPGVIDIDSNGRAFVKDARYDVCSRNVYKYDEIKDAVVLSRIRDHFIFTVESVGAMSPDVIFSEAVKILRDKCKCLLEELNTL
ncbi:DNA-directed RNA polymerases I and III subunit RPAC1 [Galleria mellonella]|uniref:DNA-directed RNA polymerases I and III subunit RPAC1 n=1 Tax=Galleria mellonella TaxID=7137 RepID=A0A6J3C9I9_GALME|nr:DNA-directed RNA polymerases I and III subunit RPAC1 [Galleria mellonella]XP_031770093.2 DNA-directed RNA polymerases I and III subunit RPAC1 [Galleria mellonella]XP_031770094.2 DNA-directed RNA polymerases I and III subunit RPAC1 [Galleria mellonella]